VDFFSDWAVSHI